MRSRRLPRRFRTSLPLFIFFRCTTFIGVCVEFVAAITWLAELFPEKRQREIVLGSTQAFASLGGLLVTGVSAWISTHANSLPALPISELLNQHAPWRYLLITGLLPGHPDRAHAAVRARVSGLARAACRRDFAAAEFYRALFSSNSAA